MKHKEKEKKREEKKEKKRGKTHTKDSEEGTNCSQPVWFPPKLPTSGCACSILTGLNEDSWFGPINWLAWNEDSQPGCIHWSIWNEDSWLGRIALWSNSVAYTNQYTQTSKSDAYIKSTGKEIFLKRISEATTKMGEHRHKLACAHICVEHLLKGSIQLYN